MGIACACACACARARARGFAWHQHLSTYYVLPITRSHSGVLAAVYSQRWTRVQAAYYFLSSIGVGLCMRSYMLVRRLYACVCVGACGCICTRDSIHSASSCMWARGLRPGFTCVYTCIYTYVRTYIHTYMHACIHTYIHTYIHAYMHTYIHTNIKAYMHTYIHTYTHTHIHTYTHTHIHT